MLRKQLLCDQIDRYHVVVIFVKARIQLNNAVVKHLDLHVSMFVDTFQNLDFRQILTHYGRILMDDNLTSHDAIMLSFSEQTLLIFIGKHLARDKQLDSRHLSRIIRLMVINETLAHVLVFLDKLSGVNLEVILFHHIDSGPDTWQDDDHKDNTIPAFRKALTLTPDFFRLIFYDREFEEFHGEECR